MPSSFFYIDAGVRQGDPLSTGLFVVFIEPLLNYLRHRLSSLGIQVPTHPTPHLLLAFSDYVSALLLDISHVPTFLSDVQTSCSAVGLTLNVSKTVAMTSVHGRHISTLSVPPSPHWVSDSLKAPTLPNSWVFMLVQLRPPPHTIRGRVLILRTVLLPILWHVGSIIYFTDDQLARLRPIIHNIVQNKTNTDLPSTSTPDQLNTLRHSVSPSLGGLGLPFVTATLLSIRLSLLIQALQQIRHSPGQVPHWFSPILQLFSATLQHAGLGLDILNTPTPRPVKLSYNNGAIYRLLGSTFLPSLLSQQRSPTQHLCQPIWLNKLLRYGPSRTSLMEAITISHHLFSQHIYRIIDFPAGPFQAALPPHAYLKRQPRDKTRPPRAPFVPFRRHLPDDNPPKESEDALAQAYITLDYSEHMRIALRHCFTPSDEQYRLWIPCDNISRTQKLHEVIAELGSENQPLAWKEARTNRVLRDCKLILGVGINFSCTSCKTASNLSRMDLNLFSQTRPFPDSWEPMYRDPSGQKYNKVAPPSLDRKSVCPSSPPKPTPSPSFGTRVNLTPSTDSDIGVDHNIDGVGDSFCIDDR
ncbi:hypothetical protein ABG067_006993 [Albugo candida]